MLSGSRLGFGLMRLPKDAQGVIIQETVNDMVDAFMQQGFTYFDTAYAYSGSEASIKKALVDRYDRNSFTIADKLPAWRLHTADDVERIFQESLKLCGVDYFDYYLLHSIEKKHYSTYEKYHCFEFLKEMKEKGKIKHIGFSFHDTPDFLEQVLTEHPEMEFVQLQLNYLDWNNGVIQSKNNLEIARKYHKPVVVMEPVKGGTLANLSREAEMIFKNYDDTKSNASWALRFIASQDGIMTILSGMSTMAQLKDNLETMSNFQPLDDEEVLLIDQVRDCILSKPAVSCTGCRYCTPGCPLKIQIPDLFTAYNSQLIYGESARYKTYYKDHVGSGHGTASACLQCGQCEAVCPQHLEIMSFLKKVAETFETE